jgi:hypothetical protein
MRSCPVIRISGIQMSSNAWEVDGCVGSAVIVGSAIRSLAEVDLRISTLNRNREATRQTKLAEVRRCPGKARVFLEDELCVLLMIVKQIVGS